jgi:hypothetical protein
MDELQVVCLRQELELQRMKIEALLHELVAPESHIPACYVRTFERLLVRFGLIEESR